MTLQHSFKPAWWLNGPHSQTLWPTLTRNDIPLNIIRERMELPDGDFLDLDWVGEGNGPIVLLLHGLAGDLRSPYVKGMLRAIIQSGWRGVLMYFRGCSGSPNRLPRCYHSGDTGDVNFVTHALIQREPHTYLACVGYSLGGNVLLKWLGETGEKNPLSAAVAISVPFDLAKASGRLNTGFSRVYQWLLLRELREMIKRKSAVVSMPFELNNIDKLRTFIEYDDFITAPLHGFKDAQDYYAQASSRQFIPHIRKPTLIVQAMDDPFLSPDAIPTQQELPSGVHIELTDRGGHVGFVTGNVPWRSDYWLEKRVIAYLQHLLNEKNDAA